MPASLIDPPARIRAQRLRQLAWTGTRHAVALAQMLINERARGVPELGALQLRLAFQGLGPSFVKLGQLISSSPGTFPQVLVEEFAHCQDSVPPEPWETVAATLESELGCDLHKHFSWIDWHPLAAGSIAQVYPAWRHDGTAVVIKVQRADLRETLRQDLRMLLAGARAAVRLRPSLAAANPVGIIEDFADSLVHELAFRIEAAQMDELRMILTTWPIRIPAVHWDLTTDRVLTMERIEGVKVSDPAGLDRIGVSREHLAETILGSLLDSALRHGAFHGDGHAGNMLVTPDGTLGLLDFGIVGRLDEQARVAVSHLLGALIERRFEAMAVAIMSLADVTNVDLPAAVADLQAIAGTYLDRPIKEIPMGRLLGELLRAANRHGVALPTGLVLLFKQILYLDGLGRSLHPGFDVFADGARFQQFLAPQAGGRPPGAPPGL
ncbi:MAG: ABC1 kinase family protein [Acidimicrobiales bacterium]